MSLNSKKILIVDDNADVLLALKMYLKRHFKEVHTENQPGRIPFHLNQGAFDLILLDMNFTQDTSSGKEGFHYLSEIRKRNSTVKVVMITAYGDVEMAVKALKEGASDFVLKPWVNEKLLETLTKVLDNSEDDPIPQTSTPTVVQTQKTKNTKDASFAFEGIIGNSESMQNVFTILKKVAVTDANVLILGENGTGKELIARAIHRLSERRDKSFINVDMGSVTETLFESELFGHKKGSFTDAKEDRIGRFEAADQGTLFLDEIGNLSLSLQSKLLTALQRRMITRVGSNKEIPVDIRLVCATNMPLYDMVARNEFRQDLLYRFNTVEIHLPPLRQRREDIPVLCNHYIEEYNQKYDKKIQGLTEEAKSKLLDHQWPGNIRELQHAIERAVIMSEGQKLDLTDFRFLRNAAEQKELNFDDYNLENAEKMIIIKALEKHQGNISHAAKALGITRAALYRRMEKYNL